MPEFARFAPRSQVLSLEEIVVIARAFTELGVDKIRLSGGEPLLRQNILWLCQALSNLPYLQELVMTTNGALLREFAVPLRAAGVTRLNISLDTLDPLKFEHITRRGQFDSVMAGIEAALGVGFERLKLNTVIMKGYNHEEIPALVAFALSHGMDLTFIEEMPMGTLDQHDREDTFYGHANILRDLTQHYTLIPCADTSGGPAVYYRIHGIQQTTRIGFISAHSHSFCATCNRVRLTTEGRLLLCLGQDNAVDLRAILRAGQPEMLREVLQQAIQHKPYRHEFSLNAPVTLQRHMNYSGG